MEKETEQKSDIKDIQEFEITKLIVETCNKIAEWHNEEPNNTSLKYLGIELVELIAGAAFKHLGLTYNHDLKLDEQAKMALQNAKAKTEQNTPSVVKDLSDEELLREIERRKTKNTN